MTTKSPKYVRYQDYVIKNGKLIGEFEEMYKDYNDPWGQSGEMMATDKAIALNLIRKVCAQRVLEIGCGLGHFTKCISEVSNKTLGIDISRTAIKKAKHNYPECEFITGDILDYRIYQDFQPDLIIMAEITWYILDSLEQFIEYIKSVFPDIYLIHILTVYPSGSQKYGKEKFTNLNEIMAYFKMNYIEWGEVCYPNGLKRVYFIGQ